MGNAFETNADPGLVELFRAESDAHIPVLSQGLLALEKGQADDQAIASMMRAAHSIKGAARIVGIDAAVRVAHVMEDCFTAAKGTRSILSSDAVDLLLGGVDALQRICALQPEPGMNEAWLESIIHGLTTVKEGRPAASSTAPAAAAPAHAAAETRPAAASARLDGGGSHSIALPADLDSAAAETLRGQLASALASGAGTIELDFSAVRQVSAAGLAVLASATREAGQADPTPELVSRGPSPAVAAMLRVTALDRALGPGA